MAEEGAREAMEIYKLHAELADRISQRRLGANRIYGGLLVGVMLFLGALLKIGGNTPHDGMVFCAIGLVGALLAVSWDRVIRSYEQLNTGKFKALRELEEKLDYRFFEREWYFLGHSKDTDHGDEAGKYLRLSRIERSAPWLFFGALRRRTRLWNMAVGVPSMTIVTTAHPGPSASEGYERTCGYRTEPQPNLRFETGARRELETWEEQ